MSGPILFCAPGPSEWQARHTLATASPFYAHLAQRLRRAKRRRASSWVNSLAANSPAGLLLVIKNRQKR
jgi:hypothetical protein